MRFPPLTGRSLAGRELHLPADFAGRTNVALLAFQQRQQRDVDAWIAALGGAGVATSPPHDSAGRPVPGDVSLVLYELPLLGAKWTPFRGLIDGGMAGNIGDPAALARTITVYGQIGQVEQALGLLSRSQVYAVVERDGVVEHIEAGWPGDVNAVLEAAGK